MIFDNMTTYTTESVLQGHPDKICDQISDAILDAYLEEDKLCHTAIECMGCGDNLIIAGEVSQPNLIDIESVICQTYKNIGFTNQLKITNLLNKQSSQLNNAIINGGAGDQGVVYGYAVNNKFNFLPYGAYLSNEIAKAIDKYRRTVNYLRPDGKVQLTIEYDRIKCLVISVQHTDDVENDFIEHEISTNVLVPFLDNADIDIQINKNSDFINGGFINDTGLTRRKIMVDTYGGLIPHGGGAFSGKDPSKIDRSAAYMARFVAKNIVANGFALECKIAIAYTFGEETPVMVSVFTEKGVASPKLVNFIKHHFDFRPLAIIERLGLRDIKYLPTSTYGHFSNSHYNWERLISL